MALLNLRKNKKEAAKPAEKKSASAGKLTVAQGGKTVAAGSVRADTLTRPHVTEKAAASTEKGVYVFEVSKSATKREIARAVQALYKVVPVKVTTVTIPAKRIVVKGRWGVSSGSKKAYVYLKKGEKIELV